MNDDELEFSNATAEPATECGAALLDDVRAALRRYCVMPSAHAEVAVVLWTVTTHLTGCFEYAPRLVLRSPEKRSGKSRVLEVVDAMVHEPLRAVNCTVAYIFRSLDADPPPTLLFDEADTVFGSKKVAEQNEDLRGLLNAGFQRGLPFGRTVGPSHLPMKFSTFAMAALAGIGRMPDTIEDRAVVVEMRRRKPTEKVAPYRTRRDRPGLEGLRDRLAEWADSVRERLTGYEPVNLGVEDRSADMWEPLIAVADMAGGHWLALARDAAASAVSNAEESEQSVSTNIRLLIDIRDVFVEEGVTFMKSESLCECLCKLSESPWKGFELTPAKLSYRLRDYGIKTGYQDSYKKVRGYLLENFADAFERYLPPLTRPNPSEGDRNTAKTMDELGERAKSSSDALESSDAFNPSELFNPSDDNPRSDPIRAGSDGFGRLTAGKGRSQPTDICPICETMLGYSAGNGPTHLTCRPEYDRRNANIS